MTATRRVFIAVGIIVFLGVEFNFFYIFTQRGQSPTTIINPTEQSLVSIVVPNYGMGSGCVIGSTDRWWYIGTARHVVKDQSEFRVNGFDAELVVVDEEYDLAILRVPRGGRQYRVLTFGEARLGQSVRSLGYNWWLRRPRSPSLMMQRGHVSCLDFGGFVTTNGGIFPGNSGGPLLSESGELLGIASCVPNVWGHPHVITACFVPARHLQKLLTENK